MKLLESELNLKKLDNRNRNLVKNLIKKGPLLVGKAGWDNKTLEERVDFHRSCQIDSVKLQVEALFIG